jgi:hypothetical protein
MKKLFTLLTLTLLAFTTQAQTMIFKIENAETRTNLNGQPINKGDEFEISVWVKPNGNTTTRSLYFDFEYQNTAFQLTGVNHTGTNGNGGALPTGSQISMSYYNYPGYSWLSTQQNNVSNGNTKYQYANYNYTSGGPKSILRVYLNWATTNNNFAEWHLIKLRFRLKTDAPGYTWDPIKLNFVAAFNQNGTAGSTVLEQPLTTVIYLDPIATSYVNAKVEVNGNLNRFTLTRVLFLEEGSTSGYIVDATSDGKLNVDQSRFKPNTDYRVMVMVNADSMYDLYNDAITVSDYTTAEAEFISQNLDGTFKNENIKTGVGYAVADINRNKIFDGGDVTKLFSQAVAVDQLIALPSQYQPGADIYVSVPTMLAADFDALTPETWKNVTEYYAKFRTGNIGTNLPLDLKYALWGDINRSHSSQVRDAGGNIKTNALVSLRTNDFVNTPIPLATSIDVSLKNIVVTSNAIEIPVSVDTKGNKVAALQFGFNYDDTKIKFDELQSQLPDGWYVFGTPKDGFIKFGAINKDLKTTISGEVIPFKLKFSTLVNGLDIATSIKVTSTMDASDDKGNQIGINLNTNSIKLTGYNNFNKK